MTRSLTATVIALTALAACQREVSARAPEIQAEHRHDAVFVNGDFEDGGLSGWTVTTYQNKGITYPPASRADLKLLDGGTNKTRIITGPTESIIPSGLDGGASLRIPKYGLNAAVVNELGSGYNVNALTQQFTVTAADVDPTDNKIHVRFALAPVLNSGGHGAADQPYFWVTLTNITKNATLFGTFNFAEQSGVPWQTQGVNFFTDWQSFDITPGNVALAIGDTVKLEVIGAGCSQSGHWGEVFVDGFGPFLPGLQVAASAPQAANAGDNITYTLNYQNRGTGASNNTTVTFNLPANVSYQAISAPGATCTTPAVNATTGAVTCNVGTLNPNAAGSFTVTVKIAALATGKISAGNYAIRADGVSSLLGPLVETNITLLVLYADLMTSISDGVAAVGWGSPYAFTFTVTNAGPSNVVGAPVSWSVPAQLTNATWSCAGSGTCGAAMGSGSIASTASLSSGQSVTYTVNATVISGSSSGSMSNLVGVSAPAGITDSNSSNNQAIDVDSIGTLRAITFAKSGTGTGRVVSSPAAVDCASGCPGSTTSFIDGTLVSVTATATTGHSFSGWSGLCTGTTNPCSFTVSGDATVTAGFAAPSFTITASAGSNGSISPSGATSVPQGSNQTFTFTPATGYHVDTVTVDGASVATASSYTFTNVTAAHTVSATFAIDTFTITASAGANGSVSPASQSANYGSNAGVTITPAAHYHVADVLVDGASVGAVATYTFSNVTAAHTVSASFAIDTFAITASAGANGSVSPASQSANYGSNATVSITPATGYHVASLTVDGATVAAAGSYTFSNVTAAHSISATFAIDTFTITASAGANGSVSPASQTANYGSNATVSITPATGHHVASLTVDGATVAAAGSYTFSNVTAAHSLSATFAIDTFTITASAGANGSVSPASQSASYGSNATVSITPAAHYHVASLTVDGAAATAATSYTFSNVTAAHSLSATFAVDTFTVSGVGDSHGGISCTSPVAYGGSSTCTVTPAAGYELVSLDDSGTPGSASGGTYVASNVTGARTITGVFKKSRGVGCSSQAECGSGQCVDGVCCNTACTGQCESCAVAGSVGTCSPSSGAPAGGRAACASDGSACGGTCDGSSRAACSYPTASTQCRSASCAAGVETHQASCDGAGACPAPVTAACNPYVCGATACGTSCTADAQCSSGFFCSNAVCVPKTQPGTTCSRDGECGTGNCVDGVCCNSACNGQCEACDVTGHVGECSPATGAPHAGRAACDGDGSTCNGQCDGVARASCAYPGANTNCRAASCAAGQATLAAVCDGQGNCPSVQTQACNPYVCGASACKGNCQVDADCSSGNWCSAGLCEPKKLPGITCGADNQCGSGFCTDGVCCNVTCNGQCEACDNSGSVGTCAPVTGAPHAGRRDCASDGSACGGACDGTSRTACAYPTASTQCRGPSCSAGVATVAAACDGAGACPAEQTVACAPFVCGASACLGNCQSDTDCSSGNWCAAGVCTPKRAPGETCGATNQCGSGFCTDGVCCDTACNGQCQACDVPGHAGTCGVVTGAPHGARTECLSDGSGCGGQCDGVNETACSYPTTTECRAASCAGGMATLAASCSMGSCPARQEQGCGDFACGVSACNGGCTSDAQCAASSFCSAGVCVTKHPNAGSCSADAQCGSGHCVDGVCCNTACEGQCQACDAAGSVGTCSAVSGAPHGARTACDSDGSRCGGACDGEHADTCAYPSSAVGCVAASCTSGVETHAASCNGAGACSAPTTASCGAFTCGESACTTGCSTDADCGADGFCAAGVCQLGGDKTQWQVQGGLGLGCSQSGGSVAALGLAMLLVLRAARRWRSAQRRSGRRARVPRRSELRAPGRCALAWRAGYLRPFARPPRPRPSRPT
ncbi:MAG: DUF11 domain-containing protein [Archangiaceae bacterium]|nr:DUF11 domain-containing protein [Archangiaceae bacterium]